MKHYLLPKRSIYNHFGVIVSCELNSFHEKLLIGCIVVMNLTFKKQVWTRRSVKCKWGNWSPWQTPFLSYGDVCQNTCIILIFNTKLKRMKIFPWRWNIHIHNLKSFCSLLCTKYKFKAIILNVKKWAILLSQCGKTRNPLWPKFFSWNQRFSNIFCKTVAFTKF